MRAGARRFAIVVVAVLTPAWAAVAASPAAADTYCVQLAPCPQNGPNFQTLQAALDATNAHDGYDTIQIGPVTLHDTHAYDLPGNPVSIFGSGAAQTSLVGGGNAPPLAETAVLNVMDPNTSVQELAIRFPASGEGLRLRGASGRHVSVVATTPTTEPQDGVVLLGGELRQSLVSVPPDHFATAVVMTGGSLIQDALVSGFRAIDANGNAMIRRVAAAGTYGISTSRAGTVKADDVVVVGRSAHPPAPYSTVPPTALDALASAYGSAIFARHLTLFGANEPGSVGVRVGSSASPESEAAVIQLEDSIVRGFSTSLARDLHPSTNDTTIIYVDYSDYERARVHDAPGPGGIEPQRNNVDVAPLFVNPVTGRDLDLHLRFESPVIDLGTPGALRSDESRTDRDGNRRILDGDGMNGPRRDMGAYEAPEAVQGQRLVKGTGKGDTRQGTKGADVFRLGAGDDTAFGGKGRDWLFGERGDDKLNGGPGFDVLVGGRGVDLLNGGAAPDRLFGGAAGDELVGDGGLDSYDAGGGNDFVDSVDGIREVVRCGKGFDSGRADKFDTLFGCEAVKRVTGGR
jgi:hypothetical protein